MDNKRFQLTSEQKDYHDYIDELYKVGKSLTYEALIEGLDVVKRAMCKDVLEAPDTVKATGKTYYLSNRGSDDNDGLSSDTPWASLAKLRDVSDELQPGDAVLFERGSVWRKELPRTVEEAATDMLFYGREGVSYGAYGTGRKPIFNGSPVNFAEPTLWIATAVPNVYECTVPFANAGVFALDHRDEYGCYDQKIAYKEMVGRRNFTGCADLKQDESYYNDVDTGKLYFCSHRGNPGERYRSIEIGGRYSLIRNQGASLIENLEFCYAGYGVSGGPCMTVRGCVFYWLGGAQLRAAAGETVVCGNAVEIYGPVDGLYVENCWMYCLCDTGVTNQLWRETGECVQKNIAFVGNVIEYCHWSVEFNNPPSKDGTTRTMQNYRHAYNFLTMGGYGFGSWMMDRQGSATLYNCFGTAETVNGICEKNIFYRCAGCLYRMRFEGDKSIVYKQNIHVQDKNAKLGYLFDGDYPYNEESIAILKQRTIQEDPLFFVYDCE